MVLAQEILQAGVMYCEMPWQMLVTLLSKEKFSDTIFFKWYTLDIRFWMRWDTGRSLCEIKTKTHMYAHITEDISIEESLSKT